MRVTIEHREEAAGLSGSKRNYFVDCLVEFSQEERAIIKARGLQDKGFTMPSASPPPTTAGYIGVGVLRTVGRLLIIGGPLLGIISGLARTPGGELGALMLIVGIGLEIYGWMQTRRQDARIEDPEQTIKLRDLASTGRFTVYAFDPSHAKTIEDDIRTSLGGMKQLLQDSAELKSKQTFEL